MGWFSSRKHQASRGRIDELRRRPRLEPLEDRTLPSATVVEVEPNNVKSQATSFSFPEDGIVQLQGTSVNKDDKDFFRFVAAQNGTLGVTVQNASGSLAKLELKDNLGNELLETQPNDGIHGGNVNLVAGRTYFLRMRSRDAGSAQYLVDLVLGGGGGGGGGGGSVVNESENNNKKGVADAFSLDANGAAQLLGTSQNQDDKDFFVFTAPRSGTMNVVVTTTNGQFAQLEVEDRFSNDVFETEPNDGINSGQFQVVAGMTYYVRLRSPGATAAGYQVDLTLA